MKPRSYDERKEEHNSTVYAYVDENNKVAYVGLTIDKNSRKRSHKYGSNSAVRKYFGKNIPEPIILKDGLTVLESQYYEDYYKKQYANDGYTLLNVAATGKTLVLLVVSLSGLQKKKFSKNQGNTIVEVNFKERLEVRIIMPNITNG